jgi:hypothetical protein
MIPVPYGSLQLGKWIDRGEKVTLALEYFITDFNTDFTTLPDDCRVDILDLFCLRKALYSNTMSLLQL